MKSKLVVGLPQLKRSHRVVQMEAPRSGDAMQKLLGQAWWLKQVND